MILPRKNVSDAYKFKLHDQCAIDSIQADSERASVGRTLGPKGTLARLTAQILIPNPVICKRRAFQRIHADQWSTRLSWFVIREA